MISLRLRLFLLVAAATALVWSTAAAWTVLNTRAEIEDVLDRRLREAAHMVASLGYSAVVDPARSSTQELAPHYDRQLSCQIWTLEGEMLGKSGAAPGAPLASGGAGYSQRVIDGTEWRVYTAVVPERGLRVMVGDTVAVRRELVNDLLTGLIAPAIVALVALAGILWLVVAGGLAPLKRITGAITRRSPDDHRALSVGAVPAELAPLTQALDALFERVERLRTIERQFLAAAAHEMQTPLAGMRTHAEIAMRTNDDEARKRSLQKMIRSVDRTAHLVRQLLELARQEGRSDTKREPDAKLWRVYRIVSEELHELAKGRGVQLEWDENSSHDACLPIAEDALILALRNLAENAIVHGPDGSKVVVGEIHDGAATGFYVEDAGRGLSAAEAKACTRAFARGSETMVAGSGLGLTIAARALRTAGMALRFQQLSPTGFRVSATG